MATIYPQTQAATRPLVGRRFVTLEQLLYVGIGLVAVLLHVYALGSRALHHDETLHAQFSWRIYTGQGYTHDPLLHGPFLYYFTAAIYFLFGDTDTTARLGAALFGIALTLLPALLRRELGRGAALLASAYLLISPVALYVGRFIRHDIFAVVFEVLMVVGLLRFVRNPRPGWHYLVAASAALMLTTMETFYLFLLIWGGFVGLWFLWQVRREALWLVLGYLGVAALALKVLPRIAGVGPLPLVNEQQALDVRYQPDNNLGAYFRKVGGVLGPFFRHPSILLIVLATLLLIAGIVWLVWFQRGKDGRTAWQRAGALAEPGTLVYALQRISGRQWLIAFGLAFAIYAVLYTGLLSNLGQRNGVNVAGLVTGVSGSFLYWLGQHSVRRGGQPTHFYLFELILYEPLLLLGGLAGIALVVRRIFTLRRTSARATAPIADGDAPQPVPTPWALTARTHNTLFAPALLAWWSITALLIYSWAGEKMPWLTLHMVVPLALLSAWSVARLGAWALQQRPTRGVIGIIGAATILGVLCLIQLNTISMQTDKPAVIAKAWLWPLVYLLIVAFAIAAGAVLNIWRAAPPGDATTEPPQQRVSGTRSALWIGLSLVLLTLLPYTLRSSLRLSFETGDTPVEPLVFVQTTPDVARVMDQLARAKLLFGSARPFGVRYDNETVWQWYLRDEKNAGGSATLGNLTDDVQAVFLLQENVAASQGALDEAGFIGQKYPLRWWLPECEVYRFPATDKECGPNPTGASLFSRIVQHPFNGKNVVDWWQFALYRKLSAPLGSSDWSLFVRPAVADMFGLGSVPKQ